MIVGMLAEKSASIEKVRDRIPFLVVSQIISAKKEIIPQIISNRETFQYEFLLNNEKITTIRGKKPAEKVETSKGKLMPDLYPK